MEEEWVEDGAPRCNGNFSCTTGVQVVERAGDPSHPMVEIIKLRSEDYLANDTTHSRMFDSSKPALLTLSSNIYLL